MVASDLNNLKIPTHLAIILDGNGRWALKKGLKRSVGHKYGAKTLTNIIACVFKLGVKFLSLYCFSKENWKRNKNEVDYLLSLPIKYFNENLNKLIEKEIKVIFSGDIYSLPYETMVSCDMVQNKTKHLNKHILNICLNYSSQDEIINAVKMISMEVKNNQLTIKDIDKQVFESYLYSKDLPSVDLLIRTSNEQRLSNFMLWQISYAELYFCKKLWPDFTEKDLIKALKEYSKRDRRYGGVSK